MISRGLDKVMVPELLIRIANGKTRGRIWGILGRIKILPETTKISRINLGLALIKT